MIEGDARGEGEASALALHRLEGIPYQVEEDLDEPVGVGQQIRDGGIVGALDAAVAGQRILLYVMKLSFWIALAIRVDQPLPLTTRLSGSGIQEPCPIKQ